MNDVVSAHVIEIAGADPDGAADIFYFNFIFQEVYTAENRRGVTIKLEQVGPLPVFQFIHSGNKAAHFFPVWERIQHCAVGR